MPDCLVYKSLRMADTYVYLARADGFDALPAELLHSLGRLEFVMNLELTPGRRLARVDVATLVDTLARRGYYLQLPPARVDVV